MSSKERMERRRRLTPQNRSYHVVAQMLLDRIETMPVILLCKGCGGEHPMTSKNLTVHCVCGSVTRYPSFALFHAWSIVSLRLMYIERGFNVAGDSTALKVFATGRLVGDVPLKSPQPPMHFAVQRWRTRSA